MLFNSFEFALFLPCVLAGYWLLRPHIRTQNAVLLLASYFFYGWWDERFLFLIAVTTVIDYNAAQLLERLSIPLSHRLRSIGLLLAVCLTCVVPDFDNLGSLSEFAGPALGTVLLVALLVLLGPGLIESRSDASRRRILISVSIVVNLGILMVFKYYGFFADSFADLFSSVFGVAPSFTTLNIVLPVGISFYTFQSMSYTIDVYRRELKPTESVIDFAAYLSFFPQLVAGPIERGKNLLPQFQRSRVLTRDQFQQGVWLIGWGLFKKIVIADNLALLVNQTFGAYDGDTTLGIPTAGGFETMIAVYAFAFQIYADFSAYSDIARGCAKLMGFELMVNFNIPYISKNPSEFWLRWHISLSSWLRDYLYIPLGGNRGGKFGTYRNLMLTMLLGGLWHGANWNFVIWGFYQGAILVIYRLLGAENAGMKGSVVWRAFHVFWFFQLTCVGWLIFRAQNINTIDVLLTSMFTDFRMGPEGFGSLITLLFYIWPLLLMQIFQLQRQNLTAIVKTHWFVQANVWLFMLMSIAALGSKQEVEFIYFAF